MSEKEPLKLKDKDKLKDKNELPEPIFEDYSTTFKNFYWEHIDPLGYIKSGIEYLQIFFIAILTFLKFSKKLIQNSQKSEIKNFNLIESIKKLIKKFEKGDTLYNTWMKFYPRDFKITDPIPYWPIVVTFVVHFKKVYFLHFVFQIIQSTTQFYTTWLIGSSLKSYQEFSNEGDLVVADTSKQLKLVFKLFLAFGFSDFISSRINSFFRKMENRLSETSQNERIEFNMKIYLQKSLSSSPENNHDFSYENANSYAQQIVADINQLISLSVSIPRGIVSLVWLYGMLGNIVILFLFKRFILNIFSRFIQCFMYRKQLNTEEFNTYYTNKYEQRRFSSFTDIINNIRFVKINGLEDFFLGKILKERKKQLDVQNARKNDMNFFTRYKATLLNQSINYSHKIFDYVGFYIIGTSFSEIMTSTSLISKFTGDYAQLTQSTHSLFYIKMNALQYTFFLLFNNKDESFLKRNTQLENNKKEENENENSVEIKNGTFLWQRKKASYLLKKRIKDIQKMSNQRHQKKRVLSEREKEAIEKEKTA